MRIRIRGVAIFLLGIVDLPISVVVDTVMLPFDFLLYKLDPSWSPPPETPRKRPPEGAQETRDQSGGGQ